MKKMLPWLKQKVPAVKAGYKSVLANVKEVNDLRAEERKIQERRKKEQDAIKAAAKVRDLSGAQPSRRLVVGTHPSSQFTVVRCPAGDGKVTIRTYQQPTDFDSASPVKGDKIFVVRLADPI